MMNPRICQVKQNPPESYADCIRACVATMIDRDDVPHVFDDRPALESWSILRKYLAEHGKFLALFAVDEHEYFMTENNPDIPYMLLHQAGNGNHAVICKNGKKIHDPAWYRTGIEGPHSLGFYLIAVIGDLI